MNHAAINNYIRKLQREIDTFQKFAEKVRDTSTSAKLRTHAAILLSPKAAESRIAQDMLS